MVFSSIEFLLFFLPAVLAGYYLIYVLGSRYCRPGRWIRIANVYLLAVSLVFYFCGEGPLIWILLFSTLIDFGCGRLLAEAFAWELRRGPAVARAALRCRRATLFLSLAANLGLLGYFKYLNLTVETINQVGRGMGWDALALYSVAHITLPLGISFFTFQTMSYTLDVYHGRVAATRNILDFGCFVTLFPQLVAGPIVRYRDVDAELTARSVALADIAAGVRRFILGLSKKVLLANFAAVPADHIFALSVVDVTTPGAWLGCIAYAIQIYFDFSGYSDMAIGLGRMFGFRFPENFNRPYTAASLREFWRRWHMTLSTFFRDYLYIALGGNRGSARRTGFNLVCVFFLCGLWHGAEWSFVVWGLYHGAFLVLERAAWIDRLLRRYRGPATVYTLLVVLVGWLLFRSGSLLQAAAFLRAMVGLGPDVAGLDQSLRVMSPAVWVAMGAGVLFSTALPQRSWDALRAALCRRCDERRAATVLHGAEVIACLGLLLLSLMTLASGTYNPFIYFRF